MLRAATWVGGIIACLLVVSAAGVTVLRVRSDSMAPGLCKGDLLVTLRRSAPQLGEPVVFRRAGELNVKRVAGHPGDFMRFDRCSVTRNTAPATRVTPCVSAKPEKQLRVGNHELFLVGDNLRMSVDSRAFGPVSESALAARVITAIRIGHCPN